MVELLNDFNRCRELLLVNLPQLAHHRHTGSPKKPKPLFSTDWQSVGAGQVRSVIEYGGQVLAG
jgi:hypothetical protein